MDVLIAKGVKLPGTLRQFLDLRTDRTGEHHHFLRAGAFTVLVSGAFAARAQRTIYVFDGQFSSGGVFYHPLTMGGEPTLRTAIDRALRDSATPSNGVFLLGKITLGERPEAAFITDWLGQYPLYTWQSDDAFLISNNILFLKKLLPSASRSLGPAIDTLLLGGPVGQCHLSEVEPLPFGTMVEAAEGLRIRRRSDHQSPGLPYGEVLDMARSEIAGHIDCVLQAVGDEALVASDLTGGADSRAVLSFLLARGTRGNFGVRCMGQYPNPDANVAALAIETFGLKRSAYPNQVVPLEKQVRYNAALSGGGRDAGGTGWPVALADFVHFKGSFGETGGASPGADYVAMAIEEGDYSAMKAVDILLKRRRMAGAIDLATTEAVQWVRGRFAHLIESMEEQGYPREHIIAEIYLRSRCRTHFGLASFLENKSHILPSPLANRWLVEARRLLPAHLHRNNKVILDLILQNGQPGLAFLPMANRKWNESVVPAEYRRSWKNMQSVDFSSPQLSRISGPLYRSVPIPDPRAGNPPMLAGTGKSLLRPHLIESRNVGPFQEMLRFFLDNLDRGNEVWKVFDRDRISLYVGRKQEEFRPNGIDTTAMGIVLSGIAWSAGFEIPPQVWKHQEFWALAENSAEPAGR